MFKACLHFGCFSPTPVSNSCSPPDSSRPIFLQDYIRDQDFPASSDTNKESFLARKILCFFKLLYMAACDLFKDEVQTKIEKLEHSTSKYSKYGLFLVCLGFEINLKVCGADRKVSFLYGNSASIMVELAL